MLLTTCCDRFATLSRAAAKAAGARLRALRLARVHPDWARRAEICERCHLRVVRCGVSYCGSPLLGQIERDPAIDGCGCPCHAKAKSPREHCPIDRQSAAAQFVAGQRCTCKWCS